VKEKQKKNKKWKKAILRERKHEKESVHGSESFKAVTDVTTEK
jgi:hypothetical protein